MRLKVGCKVRQVHVVIPVCQQCVTEWSEDTGFIAAEMIGEDQVQRGASLRLIFIVPMGVVPGAAHHLDGRRCDVMRATPVTVERIDDAAEVAQKISEYNLLALPVIDEGGEPVARGVVVHRAVGDMLGALLGAR